MLNYFCALKSMFVSFVAEILDVPMLRLLLHQKIVLHFFLIILFMLKKRSFVTTLMVQIFLEISETGVLTSNSGLETLVFTNTGIQSQNVNSPDLQLHVNGMLAPMDFVKIAGLTEEVFLLVLKLTLHVTFFS